MRDQLTQNTIRYLNQQKELYGPYLFSAMPELVLRDNSSRSIHTLSDLKKAVNRCGACGLIQYRSNLVFCEGNPDANLLILGGYPDDEENTIGRPFAGKQGELLMKILKAIGFDKTEVLTGNCAYCPVPNASKENDGLSSQCREFLKILIELVKPRLILGLGEAAGQILSGQKKNVSGMRGKMTFRNGIGLMITYHPKELLENPELKHAVWEDVKQLRYYYDKHVGDKPKWQPPGK